MCRPHEGRWCRRSADHRPRPDLRSGHGTEAILIQVDTNLTKVQHVSQHPRPLGTELNLGLGRCRQTQKTALCIMCDCNVHFNVHHEVHFNVHFEVLFNVHFEVLFKGHFNVHQNGGDAPRR